MNNAPETNLTIRGAADVPPRAHVTALILGAGDGLRLGLGPKAFVQLERRTLLERAVAAVRPFASEIIAGVRAADLDQARVLCGDACAVVEGGRTRQGTVDRLLAHATRPVVLLHEVARPYASEELFAAVLAAAAAHGAAALAYAVPVRDSLAIVAPDGTLGSPLPRGRVTSLQTPHAYRRNLLAAAHGRAAAEGWADDGTAALVVRAGFSVKLVPGSEANVKITYQDDLPRRATPAA